MSGLAGFSSFFFFRFAVVVCLLALAGMPPLAGFFIKSFFFFIVLSRGPALAIVFVVFNLMSLYFYLSNTRLLVLSSSGRGSGSFLNSHGVEPRALRALVLVLSLLALGPLFLEVYTVLALSLLS